MARLLTAAHIYTPQQRHVQQYLIEAARAIPALLPHQAERLELLRIYGKLFQSEELQRFAGYAVVALGDRARVG